MVFFNVKNGVDLLHVFKIMASFLWHNVVYVNSYHITFSVMQCDVFQIGGPGWWGSGCWAPLALLSWRSQFTAFTVVCLTGTGSDYSAEKFFLVVLCKQHFYRICRSAGALRRVDRYTRIVTDTSKNSCASIFRVTRSKKCVCGRR